MGSPKHKIFAGILLALYIAVTPSIELFHTDEIGGSRTAGTQFQSAGANAFNLARHDGTCLACLLVAGHFTQDTPWFSSIAFQYRVEPRFLTAPPEVRSTVFPARAPPSSSINS